MDIELGTSVGRGDDGDGGVPEGSVLIDFANAAVHRSDRLTAIRADLVGRVGPHAAAQAAATVSAFSGLVRVADGTGIPIDDGLAAASTDIREELALEKLGGAANSNLVDARSGVFTTVEALFENN